MRLLMITMFFLTVLFSQELSEKLIVSGNKDDKATQIALVKLKVYFNQNTQIKKLQEKNNLMFEIETLGDYSMVVIKPIHSQTLKNELLLALSPLFPSIFSISDKESPSHSSLSTVPNTSISVDKLNILQHIKVWSKEIGLQWIALLLLSLVGLILSVSSRKKMGILESTQKDLGKKQEEMENEIKSLGATSV